ncbi:MAG: OsmC family protein [Desulfobacula sp.]|uniref:OsmC family protein n=1 Tax=Desulfobacula sp. TaxID=2593537 RepID=UPI0025BA3901|nr:OsmC family protein [Desulfobacula sp.]MCD4719787.1 OsmC family protein [Desulfobacula sp.]
MSGFKVTFPGNKKIDVAFNNFIIKTDQTKENGGDETAPEPYDVFITSIGACAGIYAKSFCDVRKLSTSDMHIFIDVFFKEGQKLMEQVNITLHVDQHFPEKYIKPITKSMNGCAVKNQLHPDIKINTTTVYPDQS